MRNSDYVSCSSCAEKLNRLEEIRRIAAEALKPFAALAKPLVDDNADCAIGLRAEHFDAARAALVVIEGNDT